MRGPVSSLRIRAGVSFFSVCAVLIVLGSGTLPDVLAGRGSHSSRYGIAQPRDALSLERIGRPLPEVIAEVAKLSHSALRVDGALSDQKVTVYFREMPLREALAALAGAVDGEWQAGFTASGESVSTIVPSERRRRLLRLARRDQQLINEQRIQLAQNALFRNMQNALEAPGDADDKKEGAVHSRSNRILGLMAEIPRDIWLDVIKNSNDIGAPGLWDSTPSVLATGGLLSQNQQGTLSTFLTQLSRQIPAGSQRSKDAARLASQPGGARLEVWASCLEDSGRTDTVLFLRLSSQNGDWTQDCKLARPGPLMSLQTTKESKESDLIPPGAKVKNPLVEGREVDLKYGSARADRALVEVARAANVNLAADYYTAPNILHLSGKQQVGRLLAHSDEEFHTAHFWLGPSLIVRSRDWSHSFDREPPAVVIDRWAQRAKQKQALAFDDFSFAATKSKDLQIGRLAVHTDEHGERMWGNEVITLMHNRKALRGLASLSESQIRRLQSPKGLPLRALSQSQRKAWQPVMRMLVLYPAEALANARLTLVPREPIPSVRIDGLPNVASLEIVRDLQ